MSLFIFVGVGVRGSGWVILCRLDVGGRLLASAAEREE